MSNSAQFRTSHRAMRSTLPARLGMLAAALCGLSSTLASADTTLNVDLSKSLGPATHVASGSLYGVTESLPADINALIAPLRPKMFTNPAANVQQPVGDAILVAKRLAPTGATVTIRLADWLKGFYTFTSMNDWLDKVSETVTRRKAAALTNVYAYEIWNEPNGTYASSNPLPFNEFWRQTFVKLKELDPEIKITGPSLSYYNEAQLKDFLAFCKTNQCLPDIVGWHELGGGNLTGTLQSYRALEKQLGIGPLPISINEYSGAGRVDVEGQPGASAPLIAKFERFGVDTACISYWDVAHAGRLGSLLATNTDPNGGWWFYKWYGEMSGNMVSTRPPTPSSATALDGFANVDPATNSASVLFGGVSDGTVRVVVSGFGAASFWGNRVHAVVEHTPFLNRTTIVKKTDTLSDTVVNVANDQVTVTVTGFKSSDGYRLRMTPAEVPAGGATGTDTRALGGASSAGTATIGGTAATSSSVNASSVGGSAPQTAASGGLSTTNGGAGGTRTARATATSGEDAGGRSVTAAAGGLGGTAVHGTSLSVATGGSGNATNRSVTGGQNSSMTVDSANALSGDADGNSASGCNCHLAPRQTNQSLAALAGLLFLLVSAARKRRET